jgi:hypothetical protein
MTITFVRFSATLSLVFCFLLPAASAPAARKSTHPQVWNGYLIDLLCAEERFKETDLGPKHTRKCLQMPVCDRSGFGILLDDNRVLKFDNAGNTKVRSLLQRMGDSSKIKVRIAGNSAKADVISISRIELEQ